MEEEVKRDWQERTRLLLGDLAIERLNRAHVAVFGVGGVGGYVIEGLARAGVGEFTIIDNDIVDVTNLNRQIIATSKNIGQNKCHVCASRIHDINPKAIVHQQPIFYLPETVNQVQFKDFDYVVDAVDTMTAKILIIEESKKNGVPVISAMGAGNKLDPTKFQVADIYDTKVCPLAKVLRHELRKRQIQDVKVVYSTEKAISNQLGIIGSISFVPSVVGLIIAGEVAQSFIERSDK